MAADKEAEERDVGMLQVMAMEGVSQAEASAEADQRSVAARWDVETSMSVVQAGLLDRGSNDRTTFRLQVQAGRRVIRLKRIYNF